MERFNYRDIFKNRETSEVRIAYYIANDDGYGISFELDYIDSTQKMPDYYLFMHGTDWDFICRENCTGLKDKNGKLIYEKDYILYKEKLWVINIDKLLGIELINILTGDIIIMNDVILYNCEVKGNEFEPYPKI